MRRNFGSLRRSAQIAPMVSSSQGTLGSGSFSRPSRGNHSASTSGAAPERCTSTTAPRIKFERKPTCCCQRCLTSTATRKINWCALFTESGGRGVRDAENGSTGSIIAGCLSRSATFRRRNSRPRIINHRVSSRWRPDSPKKAGAVQNRDLEFARACAE